jgi:hypothetical protein
MNREPPKKPVLHRDRRERRHQKRRGWLPGPQAPQDGTRRKDEAASATSQLAWQNHRA